MGRVISVHCVCGREYKVPADKAGKKLQCRRCGNIQRIPRPEPEGRGGDGVFIPFRTPGESDEGQLELQPTGGRRGGGGLALRDSLRRCPSCGFQDDPEIVVCVRCGYDWRTGQRIEDAHEASERSGRQEVLSRTHAEANRLNGLTWLALSPLGIVVGPVVIVRSFVAERALRRAGERPGPELRSVRLTAAAGAVLWLSVGLVLGFLYGAREGETDRARAVECVARLERTGRAVRARVQEEGRFPPAGQTFGAALRQLPLAAGELSCPLHDGLYPYRQADPEVLTTEASPEFVLLWDPEPHPDPLGRSVYRALRWDGTVVALGSEAELEEAIARPAFDPGAATETPEPDTSPPPEETGGGGDGPAADDAAWQRRVNRFLAFAGRIDDTDPALRSGLTVAPDYFTTEVGIPPRELVPLLLRQDDAEVRRQAARMLARLELPDGDLRKLARPLADDPAADVRYAAAMIERRLDLDGWLEELVEVAESGDPEAEELALGVIGAEAAASAEGARRVLVEASRVRQRVGAEGDDAIFDLPDAALPNVIPHLADRITGPEAAAVLYTADQAAVDLLIEVVHGRLDAAPHVQTKAFQTLDLLRVKGTISLADYLTVVDEVHDDALKAEALAGLANAQGEPSRALVAWALERLRGSLGRGVAAACAQILARAGRDPAATEARRDEAIGWLLDDLLEEGEHGPVLDELMTPRRLLDPRVAVQIGERLRGYEEPLQLALLDVLRAHPTEAAVEAILVLLGDSSPEVRLAAARALRQNPAPRGHPIRVRVSRALARRLGREREPEVEEALLLLCHGPLYCWFGDELEEHRCASHLQSALVSEARGGSVPAIRALATHPDERVLTHLVSILDAAPEGDAIPELISALQALTGEGMTTGAASEWRDLLTPMDADVRARLRGTARRSNLDLARDQERAVRAVERRRAALR